MGVQLFILVALLASLQLGRTEDFHPDRTLLMDVYPRDRPTNFLFRGNMPVINGSFAYSEIVMTMRGVAGKFNYTLPANFTLIDVSYLNIFEESDLEIERKFFESNPELGKLENRVIIGSFLPPPQEDPDLIKDIIREYIDISYDKLPELMTYFHSLLMLPSPTVIYSHCEAGTDRTGEVSGAYYMRYLNMTFSDALYIDNHVQSRDMYKTSRNGMQWYCFYLKFVEDFSHLDCVV
ncbi:hypothetical protein GBAR_LOCUS18717 [Geodia barretti]|uniref:Tyrosine specific protein phosphatases domain-containing protein n=1 Tax=Geodia barretti TaxID=519541 RepID=A0AA35SQ18_GEOBA|nr:hypothetical protein GBAR_LOCUS18717 [Geodia barretti]